MKLFGLITEQQLKLLRSYQRPMRAVLWAFCIFISYLGCVTGWIACMDNPLVQSILYIMAGDLGIYTISRTAEKLKKVQDDSLESSEQTEKES